MVNVNKCKDIWQFYPLLKQMLSTNPDGFQEFVEANFENAQDVYNMFEGGVSQDSTSPVLEETEHTESDSTPQEMQFVPSRPSHTVEETLLDTDTLMLGGARLGILFTDFKRRIVSASILDLQTVEPILNQNKTGVGANEMTGLNRTILNTNIGKYKLELLNKVSKYIGGPVYNTMEETCEVDENGMYKWESTLQEFASREADTNSPEYISARESAVILKQFDNWLASNAPFIRIATPYKDTHLFNPDRYVYVGPSTKMFQSFSSDEYMDAHKYGLSDLVKTIVDVFPEYTEEGKPIPGTQVGVAGMYSIGTKLKHYFQNSGNAETRARWYKGGVNRDWNKLFEDYIRFVNTSKSSASASVETETDKDITTLTTKMYGLQKLFAILPDDLKVLFSHTIDKTVASEYRAADVETTKVGEDTIVYGRAKNYSERPQTTWKSYIKDCVLGASMLLRTTPSMKATLNQKYKIEFKDNSIYVNGKPFVKSTEAGWSLVETDHELIKALAQDVLQFPIPEEYSEIHAFFPAAANVKAKKGMPAWGKLVATVLVNGYAPLNNMMNPQDGNVAEIAKVMSVIYGSESATVVKNQKGNNLPMHQVTCLAYRHLDVVEHMKHLDDASIDRVKSNLIFQNSRQVLTPQCRTDFISGSSRHKTSTSFSKLNARDSLACSMIFDFWKPLFESDTDNYGRIALQAHTYADKSKQLLQRFDLRRSWKIGGDEVNFLSILQQICDGNKDAIVEMANIWRELEKEQINLTVQNIISDFGEVYGKNFTTIKGVNDFLASQIKHVDGTTETRSLESVRKDFLEAGVPFIENYHAVMFDGKVRINECITTFHKTVNDDASWKDFYTNQFNNFKESAREALIPAAHLFTVKNGDQYTPKDMRGKQEKGKEDYIPLNFVAAAYFLANNIFEGQYNRLMVGDYYLHDNKTKGTTDPSVAAASRYISQIKRMVIYGATTHTYAQGLDNGVKSTVNVAVMEDLPSSVQNMLGETAKMDSCDGSGLTSPYYSRMENNSLLDAAVKDVKKTIMHDIGANGVPVLLKWAEYAITNEKRRMSYGSDVPYNHIFNKMHSHPVHVPESESETLQTTEAKTIYYRDQNTGEHHKRVIKVYNENGNNVAAYYDFVVDINGKTISEHVAYKESFETLADLDAIFGGCWSESFNDNNELEYSESSLDEVFDLIVKYDWRDKMIGIVANKSAVKVGVQNLNSVEAWTSPNDDRNPLYYFSMSTKFGGLQMDADHDLEDSDVTEMTQMISALVQNGYSIEIADKVYHDIGAYCVESIADIREALKDVDSDKLFQIFGKAIVEAFATGDKDTLGLAQAFIAIATKNMQESGLKPIPFSSMSINGIFNSTVTTTLVKKAIRRHYEGVAAVLNPSFGSIQVYNIEGSTYTYPELLDWYLSHKTIDRNTWSLAQLLNVSEFGDSINPTYKAVDPTTYIDFEDTITWKNDDGTWSSHKVTDYKTYWEARRIIKDHDKVYIKTLAPKNLKGADTKFTLATTDGTGATATRNSSMFETVYAQLLYATYDIKANTTEDVVNQVKATLANLLGVTNDAAWEETFNVKYKDILVNAFGNLGMNSEYSYKRLRRRLAKSQQKFLGELHKAQENISENDPIYTFKMDGAEYNISAVEVVPAQIIMGRYYAKQFGLSAGDSIGKIRNDENFFFNKAKTQYKTDADGNVDLVLYDGQGDQIHVIYDPDGRKTQSIAGQLSRCNGFTIVDGSVYYKDKLLCKSENKQFYSYKVGDVEHKVVIVSHLNALSDLTKNDWTDYTECLYRQDNASWILSAVRGKIISENLITPEGIKSLLEEEKTLKNRHIGHIAFSRKKSFEKSLNFIGTRIPCQSMQSFAPMRVAAFSNSTTNEVFVPTNIMWLEGSDLDIDKQYILGYSIADSGRIFDGEGDHHKEDRLKNNVVDNIWKTVTDPRNQINLTQPISTDDFKAIAAKSSRGKLAESMSIYNPFHKYSMQVENMVGKDCIGSVATALKGFFALTYMYNMRMNEMCDAIESGNIDLATQLFNRYFKQPLANVNVERLDYVLTLLPEGDFKNKLLTLKDKIEDQEDMSMLMGQLLNAATDNAKELILKKINADSTWIDLYTSAFMEGKSLEGALGDQKDDPKKWSISKLMLHPRSQKLFDGFDSSVFAGSRPFGKLPYLTGIKSELSEGNIKDPILDQLIDQAELAEETRVLGRFLKINQGLITNRAEMLAYVGDIQAFVEKRFEKSTNLKECRKYLNKLNEGEALTIEETGKLYSLLPDFDYDVNTNDGKLKAQQILQELIAKNIEHTQFDVYRFASDSDYRTKCIEQYEDCKVKFNILEAVATSPHFDKMFGMVSTNEDILTSLSARNRLEGLVIDRYRQQARLENWSNGNINASTAKNLKDRVDDVLRKDWILEKGIEIPIIKGQRYWNGTKFVEAGSTKQTRLAINDEKQILSLRQFLENIVIPLAKEQHPENKFLSLITMGLQGGIQYWRPMINMSTVSQSIKTKEQYEGMANDFAKLADVNFVVDGIDTGHTIVDWIYLYNLIVNRDRFGATTFTRFFESLVPTGRVDYFAFDFANWLDKIDVEQTFENHRAEFLRYAYEDDPESDTYADHFGIRGKEVIVEDSETFDPWDELKYNSGATDKEIESYKQRADKLYIVPVVSVNNPSSRQMPEDFSWSGNKQKWIVTFEGSASYQVLSGLKTGDSVTFGNNTVQIQAPLRKWINDGELETVGVVKQNVVAAENIDSNISAETLQQVELIFARNPKLKEVGTPLEYARYIQTIYPNSVDKSVYWHGSDSDFSEGFKTATRGEGSGSPHTKSRNDFYLAKQAWTVLQYVSGVNRKSADKKHGFANWVKLWWELKEIMSNGRRENNDWKDLVIGPENVRQAIPNKAGVFNRDSGGENGKWLKERKADYGYENKSDKEFFEEILGVKWGIDTFNTWTQRNAEIFKSLQTSAKGIYPAVINVVNPIREIGQNTYYEEQRGLFTKAKKDGNDAILGAKTDNEFGSDVAVVFDTNNVHFLGTTEDIENFRTWKQSKGSGNLIDLSNTPIYRGYATMSEDEAVDLDETVAGTAMDYIKGFDAGYHFTSSRSEAHDYATGRTDKSEETFINDEGQVITQQNRHYRGDYAHVSAYTIDPSAKVVYFDDVLEANAHPELMRDADVIVLKQGTLGSTNTEYIVRKGAKHLVHKINGQTKNSSTNAVQELKPGTVVKYNDELYLIRGFSSSGGLQLIKTDGSNYSGTPQPDKITAIIKQYPVITHNGTDYIVTDRDNIYTLSSSAKGNRQVYKADSSNVGKDRNFLISRALVARGKARFHQSQNYIVTEGGVVYKTNGEIYESEYKEKIIQETYPEKFTTQPIAPVHVESVVQNDDTTLGIVLNQGQQDAVDGVLKFLNDPTDYEPVIVNGKAGTGKTTIVNEILKKYGKRQSVWIVALSHKAKQVLMDKISLENKDRYNVKGKTIASSQGKTLDFDTGKFADGDTDTNFPAIMFVDEASMVEDEAFAKFLTIAEEHHTKIVFLGDSGQLPPIEENEEDEYKHQPSEISPVFKLSKQSKLTERVRQGEDSPILPYADYYWNYSHKMSKVLPTRADNVQIISSKGALLFDEVLSIPYSFFEKAIKTANPNLIKIVTYTNAVRQELNQRVHERFFGDAVWGKGELVMFFKNYGAGRKMIANSSEAVILEVGSEKPHSAEFDGIYVKINKIDLTIKVNGETRQIQVFATPKDKELWNEFLQKFADKISKMPAGREKSSKWRTYYDLKDNTFADIDYSYAITAHKSQGSTYDTVIVNVPDINKMNDVDAARGIYTAITRAKNVAVISGVRTDTPYEGDLLTLNDTIENNKKPKSEPSLSINPEQKSSSETKAQLKELISSINSPYLKEVTDADLEGVDDFTADAEGFVKDGIIYINTDRASVGTVIHELGHLYLGALKSDPEKREHYYDILANMHEYCDLWHEMQGNQFYANKRGSDFDEEIAARLIEMYYNGSIMSSRDKALAQELIMISGISLENLPKPEKMQWMSENYKIKQSVATLKNKLYEDEVIKDIDC